jgi:hypothetical protein
MVKTRRKGRKKRKITLKRKVFKDYGERIKIHDIRLKASCV